jgi:tetratricopeptide (TPR) repeat protein
VQREETFDQYTRYYAVFMREREPLLKGGAQIKTLNEIEADIDNIRLAWMLAIGRRDPVVIRGLLVGLSMFYLMRSRQHESREMFGGTAQYLAGLDDLSEDEQIFLALIKVNQALAIRALGERHAPLALYQEALPVLDDLDGEDAVVPLIMLGELGIWPAHDFATTERLANRALALDDRWGKGRALHMLGDLAHHQIDYDTSQRLYQQSLAISRAIGDRWSEGTDLNMLGEVAYTLGDYAGAEQLYRESMALGEAVGDRSNLVWCMDRLADVIALQGRYADARVLALRGIELGHELGSRARIAYGLLSLVEIAAGERDYEEALRRFEQAQEAFDEADPGEGRAWLAISRCQIALALENADDLERFARSALEMFEAAGSPFGLNAAGSPWGRSAALHYLGEAARMNGDYDAARDYLRRAVRLADDSRSIMLLTRYLIGFAALFADTGDPVRAVELLTFVIQNRATWAVSRARAVHLLDGLAAVLPSDEFAAAEARGAALTASAVAGLLL